MYGCPPSPYGLSSALRIPARVQTGTARACTRSPVSVIVRPDHRLHCQQMPAFSTNVHVSFPYPKARGRHSAGTITILKFTWICHFVECEFIINSNVQSRAGARSLSLSLSLSLSPPIRLFVRPSGRLSLRQSFLPSVRPSVRLSFSAWRCCTLLAVHTRNVVNHHTANRMTNVHLREWLKHSDIERGCRPTPVHL